MNDTVLVAMSDSSFGSMSADVTDAQRATNRRAFLASYELTPEQTVLVGLTYEGNDYSRFYTISADQAGDGIIRPSSIVADALFTTAKNVALFLPIADCIAAVVFDPATQALGLAHLGRHNLIQNGGQAVVDYMQSDFGSRSSDLQIWLSPAAGRENYPLYDFDNRSLHEVALEQLLAAGVSANNIVIDTRDTTRDISLFSHSQFLRGTKQTDGRQAVVAMMRP